jgi:hypothetical protein
MSNKKNYRILAVLLASSILVFSLMAGSASAQDKPVDKAADAAQADEDEKLDASFRKFGQAAGAAYQCTPEAEREKLVSEVRRAFNRIGQLFGTDRAFYFAVSFGKATDEPFDKAKCGELITKLRESVLVKKVMN